MAIFLITIENKQRPSNLPNAIDKMFIKTQEQQSELASEPTVTQSESKKLADALSLYLQSIQANEAQPEWIYGNSITLSAQINCFDVGMQLKEKAEKIYPENEEIARASALLYEKQDRLEQAIELYQKSVNLNPLQPEWVYIKIYDFMLQTNAIEEAEKIGRQGLKYYPQSSSFQSCSKENNLANNNQNFQDFTVSNNIVARETPKSIEHNVDLNVSQIRRRLMDCSIVTNYEILLEQMLCGDAADKKQIDTNALINCLAEIKTDIHYLKTKLFDSSAALVDPQAKQNVDIAKIVNSSPAIPVKCELKNRIVGSGWHNSEQHGRWSGPGTLSSIVLPYPDAGKYRLEVIVRAEARAGLLKTLKISVNDRPLVWSYSLQDTFFPVVISAEVAIETKNNPFLSVDLAIDRTVIPQASDNRSIGLLIESISLIPLGS